MRKQKPTLGFWQIWNMCFGFLGIQFGFALQNANVSRIFQSLGASIDEAATLLRAIAAFAATTPRSVAVMSLSGPTKLPIGVRAPPRM